MDLLLVHLVLVVQWRQVRANFLFDWGVGATLPLAAYLRAFEPMLTAAASTHTSLDAFARYGVENIEWGCFFGGGGWDEAICAGFPPP